MNLIDAMRAREAEHNEDRYPDRPECDFTQRGSFGESVGVAGAVEPTAFRYVPTETRYDTRNRGALSAPVTAFVPEYVHDTTEPPTARPEPSDEATRSEMRKALHRLSTNLRQSVEAQQRALADIGDLMEELR